MLLGFVYAREVSRELRCVASRSLACQASSVFACIVNTVRGKYTYRSRMTYFLTKYDDQKRLQ
jgi:hypothetical protein